MQQDSYDTYVNSSASYSISLLQQEGLEITYYDDNTFQTS